MTLQEERVHSLNEEAQEIKKTEEDYMKRASWDVYENANMNISYSNFRNFLFDRLLKKPEILSAYLPPAAVKDHINGEVHIHKLPDSLFIPYCIGWSFSRILRKGLITPTIISKPANHLDTAIAHLTNFFFFGSQEYTGAQAASGFDVFLAPFVRHDNLSFDKVKQAIQHMLFNLNYPARAGFQSPFTNITIVMDTSKHYLKEKAIIGGKILSDTLEDYLDEALMIDKALFELLLEGDAKNQPFTFPIPTIMITRNFDWNGRRWGELTDLIFEALARRGSAYLLNGYSSNVEALYAMCLHPSEYILIKDDNIQLITIGELFEKYAGTYLGQGWYDVNKKFSVPSLNPETYSIEWVPVKRLLKVKSNKIAIIRTGDGREIKTTPDHPIVIYTRKGLKIKLARDVEKGDLMLIMKKARYILSKKPVFVHGLGYIDREMAYFVGLFLADGNYLRMSKKESRKYSPSKLFNGRYYAGVQITLGQKDAKIIEWLKNFAEKKLKKRAIIRKDPRWKGTIYVYIYDHNFATNLAKNGVYGLTEKKRIPWFIWNSPPKIAKAFIQGFMDGDGYKRRLEIHINNDRLAKELAILMNALGIQVTIRIRKNSQVLRIVHIKGHSSKKFLHLRDTIFYRVPRYVVATKAGMPYHYGLYSLTTVKKYKAMTAEAERLNSADFALIPVESVKIINLESEEEFIDIELERNHLFVHSMGTITHNCCRLTLDTSRLNNNGFKLQFSPISKNVDFDEIEEYLTKNRQAFGIWALPDATGSLGVVTLNMPRLAALSKGEWDIFEDLLYSKMENARKVMLTWRKRYAASLQAGFMPISRIYLGHFRNHFNTFGIIGLPEAAANFMRDGKLWRECERRRIIEAVSVMKKMVSIVRKKAEEYEREDGYLYNVEEIPGESTGYRLAKLDMALFKEEWRKGEIFIPSDGIAPFYSNSIIPYYADVSIGERAKWEGEVQQEFTGGVMMHIFLQESPDPKALKSLIQKIAMNTKVVYFSITPTIAVCRKCGWTAIGLFDKCPKCGGQVDLWSRIVGYYRPVKSWNVGKKAEFKLRVQYLVHGI
ncbi:MAG: hypothetical protein J7K82_02635 [Thermoproteales archaeon]|nr:hypothetical protein [Thermoproteales archaeon]